MSAPAISLRNVSKLYRRYGGRQFATLKSALLSGDGAVIHIRQAATRAV